MFNSHYSYHPDLVYASTPFEDDVVIALLRVARLQTIFGSLDILVRCCITSVSKDKLDNGKKQNSQ